MPLDLHKPLPEGSYAWCSDCPWKDEGEQAHVHGKAHTELLAHIVHVYENGTP